MDLVNPPSLVRRCLLAAWCMAATANTAWAQGMPRPVRIGVLRVSAPQPGWRDEFVRSLAAVGLVEGQHITLDFRWVPIAEGVPGAQREAGRLLQEGTAMLLVGDTPAAHGAVAATRTVPIVLAGVSDAVSTGLVSNLARPGGNIAGVSRNLPALAGKQIELLKEVLPQAPRVAFLGAVRDPAAPHFVAQARQAAQQLGLQLQPVLVEGPAQFDGAFAAMAREGAQALVVQPLFVVENASIAARALRLKLPSISAFPNYVAAGGLLSYATASSEVYERTAAIVKRLLQGERAGEGPIEQPGRYVLHVNQGVARQLGVVIPPLVLMRADHVVE